jgi:hypothetical protein
MRREGQGGCFAFVTFGSQTRGLMRLILEQTAKIIGQCHFSAGGICNHLM